MVSMYYFGQTCNSFIEWLSLETGLKHWLDKMGSGIIGFVFTIGSLILWLVMMLFYFSMFKFIFLIVGSPVFSYLSEKTEAILENDVTPFTITPLIGDVIRGTQIASRSALWQTVYCLSIFLVSAIPVLGWLTPFMAVLIECYYFGFSMLDYSMKRNNIRRTASIAFIGNHKGLAIGNGIVFYVMHLIPIIGWVLAPAYAVVAATLSLIEFKKNNIE